MSKVMDYTKQVIDQRRGIERCPQCGRNGLRRDYTTGEKMFAHVATVGPLGGCTIQDHCYFPAPKQK